MRIYLLIAVGCSYLLAAGNGLVLGFGYGSSSSTWEASADGTIYSGNQAIRDVSYTEAESVSGSAFELYLGYRSGAIQTGITLGEGSECLSYFIGSIDYLIGDGPLKPFIGVAAGTASVMTVDDETIDDFAYGIRLGVLYDLQRWSLGLKFQQLKTDVKLEENYSFSVGSGEFRGVVEQGYKDPSSLMLVANYRF